MAIEACCIRCGARFNLAAAMQEDTTNPNLRAFWDRYCPEHRYASEPQIRVTNVPELTPAEAKAFRRGKGTITIATAAQLLGTDEDEVLAYLRIVEANTTKPVSGRGTS